MEGSDPEDIQQDLQAVSTAILHFERIAAARALGGLPFTNEMIVQALVAAQELDEHAGVREIAAEALQSQVHQAFIKEHPGLISQAVESARRDKEKRTSEEEARIAEEFQRTCKRQITLSLLPGAAVIVYFGIMILLIDQADWLYPLASPILFIFMGVVFWLSWKNWRCPSCDGWLGGWKAQVNPLFVSAPTWCPHCGKKLL